MSLLTDQNPFSGTPSGSDVIHIVDVSDPTDNPAGTSFQIPLSGLTAFYSSDLWTSGASGTQSIISKNSGNATNSDYSVVYGTGNTIQLSSRHSTIGGGVNNTISDTLNGAILGGNLNLVDDLSDNSVIVGGENNSIANVSKHSIILGGTGNTITGSLGGMIAGGRNNTVSADFATAKGYGTTAGGFASTAEGFGSQTYASYCHAEGYNTVATGLTAHAEGWVTSAMTAYSHAEGNGTLANGTASHAEGFGTIASAPYSHAEGYESTASGQTAHAEGQSTRANGAHSHAQGHFTSANGMHTHTGGYGIFNSYVIADGESAFNHSMVDLVGSYGVYGDNSSILGGKNNYIDVAATGSTILGGSSISATTSDTTYVPDLNIVNCPAYADDTAAGVGGLTVGMVYQTTGAGAAPLNAAGILMIKQ